MLKKLLVVLIAAAFSLGAYAQAPKSDTTKAEPATPAAPKGQTGAKTKKATPAKPASKSAKAEDKKAKTKADATTTDVKKDAKK